MSSIRGWVRSPESIVDDWVDACSPGSGEDSIQILVEEFKLDDRVKRLFACELCRSIWDDLCYVSREAVLTAERFADNEASSDQLREASILAGSALDDHINEDEYDYVPHRAAYAADAAYGTTMKTHVMLHVSVCVVRYCRTDLKECQKILVKQGKLLASMVGLGWKFDPEWRTSTAVQLASHIYGKREWGTSPILADALQDAGCDESVLLKELRNGKAVWCRGSRILDEILGKRI